MLFDAHARAFAAFGCVPRRGIYDNMKTAVDKVGRGKERAVNARFEAMCSHYLFEREHGLDAVLHTVQAALDSGHPSAARVLNVLSRLRAPVTNGSLATTKLQLKEEPAADVGRYETLRANPPEDRHV